ncbi:MAG: hypothetical protein WAK48_02955 [Candidatus Acidiferrum sp.]
MVRHTKSIISGVAVPTIIGGGKYVFDIIKLKSEAKSYILDHTGHPSPPSFSHWPQRKKILVVTSLFSFGFFGYLIWTRHENSKPHALPPSPPASISAFIFAESPFSLKRGNVIPLEKSVWPCSYGKTTGHGLDALPKLPGGPELLKPYLILLPTRFAIEYRNQEPVYLFFETEVTNRGESSITKDWGLCVVDPNGKAAEFTAEAFDPTSHPELGEKPVSLIAATDNAPLEHGHSRKGWLLFKVPKDSLTFPAFNGSIYCRDYMERRAFFTFATSVTQTDSIH